MYRHLERDRYLDLTPKCVKSREVGEAKCPYKCQGVCTNKTGNCLFQFFEIVRLKEDIKSNQISA